MSLPFKLRQESDLEKWRASTFWEKEPELLAWIRSFDPKHAFLDVGANIGLYSLYAASLFPKMAIFAVEPSRLNYAALLHNKQLNDFAINCWNLAVAERRGLGTFKEASDKVGDSGGSIAEGNEIPITTLEEILSWHFLTGPWNIKIDTDHDEVGIIRGIRSAWDRVNSVLIEVNSDDEEIIEIFVENGFTSDNEINRMSPHSTDRRIKEGIAARNVIFTRLK